MQGLALRGLAAALVLPAGACDRIRELLEPPPPNCEERTAFYPDPDGDGVGGEGAVYLGCEAPPGWTDLPPPGEDTDPADTDPADTDPADTDPADTDPADTDPADTDPADTDPADTDPGLDTGSPEDPPP
jgi:hypothetical protein